MEISFVISAIRRYWWVLVAFMVLGGGAALSLSGGATLYESRGQLLITRPITADTSSIDADRYIDSEVQRLRSGATADEVAKDLGNQIDPATIAAAATFEQAIASNVVTVKASASSAARAQQIADSYLRVYLEDAQEQLDATVKPALDALRTQEAQLKDQLTAVDAQIAEVMRPYLKSQSVPSLEVINPSLASQRETSIADYSAIRAEIRDSQSTGPRVTSEIVSPATLPTAPVPSSEKKLIAAGTMAGLMIGLATTIILGRLSSRVLDDRQVEEVIGAPIAALMPDERGFTTDRDNMLRDTPRSAWPFSNTLCVRAETQRQVGESLTVLVTSPSRGAGATTIASMMANHFAAAGLEVLLIDADTVAPELSRVFTRKDNRRCSLATLTTRYKAGEQAPARRHRPGLTVAGINNASDVMSLRRSDPREVMANASRSANVVIVDGGSLLESATTVQLMQLVDAVVVAIPINWQDTKELTTASHLLRSRQNGILPVLSPVSRRNAKRAAQRRAEFQGGEDRPSGPVELRHEGQKAATATPPPSKRSMSRRHQQVEPQTVRLPQSSDG